MAKLIVAMNQSLDGYVDHTKFSPDLELFRHFIDEVRAAAGMIYGRRMYEVMRYWDDDQPDWEPHEHEYEYPAAWRSKPKWVVSRSLTSVGPNATLISENVETAIRTLKTELTGDIEVAGPELAQSLTDLALIDAYQIYLHPVVVGGGKPFFSRPQPALHLEAIDRIVPNVVRLTYVRA